MKNIRKEIIKYVNEMSAPSFAVLCAGLPPVVASLLVCSADFFDVSKSDPLFALFIYPAYFEHIMMGIGLLLGAAVLFDVNEKFQ